jgi:poly(hydroxyalkanoate) granule-associated protein
MSDDGSPKINITRGSRSDRRSSSSSNGETAPSSAGSGVNFSDVATAAATGVRNAWLAGLGAISYAESVGAQVFGMLVEEGKTWERSRRETQNAVKRKVDELRSGSEEAAQSVESTVREEVDAAMSKVGVPTQSEMDTLRSQVDDLNDKIDRLTKALQKKQEGEG